MRRLHRGGVAVLCAALAAPLLSSCGSGGGGTTVSVYSPPDGAKFIEQVAPTCATDRYDVKVFPLPKGADDQRLQLARRLAGSDTSVDLMGLDVVWTAEFAEAGWIEPLPDAVAARVSAGTLEGTLNTAKWDGALYAAPTWTNTQLLWYRKDLVGQQLGVTDPNAAPPQLTWDQLLEMTAASEKAGGPSYIGATGAQYEGLMVWFNGLLQSAGGQIVADDGETVTLTDTAEHRAATVAALDVLKRVATAPGHDPSISQSMEAGARLTMEAGKSLFEINWPFVFAGMRENSVADAVPFLKEMTQFAPVIEDATPDQLNQMNALMRQKFDFAPYPSMVAGQPARVTLGGINLGLASTSKHKAEALEAMECLRSESAQKIYAVQGGTPPTLSSIYDDPEFRQTYPMGDLIRNQLLAETAAVRPISPVYQTISTLLVAELSPVGHGDPEQLADKLAAAVTAAVNGEGLIP